MSNYKRFGLTNLRDAGRGKSGPSAYYQTMEIALRELLIEKNIFSADDIRRQIEFMDGRNAGIGASMVARAWLDAQYKARALANGSEAAKEIGIEVGPTKLIVLENTEKIHNLVVCTLCSCYPRMLLGLPPDWYKSKDYRSRAVREPRAMLREFGTDIPGSIEVRVHDSTADMRYLVMPRRPARSDQLTEAQLATLVTRDCMIGVALVQQR